MSVSFGSGVILVPGGEMRTVVSQALISATSNRLNLSAPGVRQNNRSHLPSTSSQNSSPPSTPLRREHRSSTTLLAQGPMGSCEAVQCISEESSENLAVHLRSLPRPSVAISVAWLGPRSVHVVGASVCGLSRCSTTCGGFHRCTPESQL